LKRAAELGLTGIQVEMLIVEIHARTKNSKTTLKRAFAAFEKIVADEKAKTEEEERKNAQATAAAQQQKMRDEERERLLKSCKTIVEVPDLLKIVEGLAHRLLGVVNEGAAVRATYLTGVSRLLESKAVRLLRTGASASGKNYPVEQTLKFFPKHAVVQVSGSSPKSLPYEGGADPDALKHKLLSIPEAIILANKRSAGDNEYAVMFRTILSEGCLVYKTVVKNPITGMFKTETIIKNGPIAAILTTADEIDDQLETRCLIQGTDESGAQTEAIVESILSDIDEAPFSLDQWIDYQLLLEMDMPPAGYQVRIPFRTAVRKAWRPGFLKAANMRMRRDVDSFLVAVKASALTHKFQRETAENGMIIATLDDYRHALEAFDEGLSVAHGHVDDNVVAVVEAVEAMLKEAPHSDLDPNPDSVKVSIRDLSKRLRIKSTSTAKTRLDEAIDAGAVEYDDTKQGGRGRPRYFRVARKAAELKAEPHGGVFPPVEAVRRVSSFQGGDAEQDEQNELLGGKLRI
jgi:hypothetical protein